MKFNIIFYYMDGETFQIEIHPDDIKLFIDTVGRSEVYYNEYRGVGVWVSIEKVRYFQVEKVDEDGNRVLCKEPLKEVDNGMS